MNRIVDPLSKAIFDSDLISTRLTLAIAELFWFVMLMWPGDTFDRPTYFLLNKVATEFVWAIVFGVTSILQFAIVLQSDFHKPWARVFAMWNASLWALVVCSMLLAVYPPPAAVGGEIALMLAALWIWARPLIVEAGVRRYGC